MEAPKEENVEYHIEIQKCEEGGENNDGEVMYVLDFGGADISENVAMSIAQWAADRSLSLEDGNSSFVVQDEGGDVKLATTTHHQVMQVDSSTVAGGMTEVENHHHQQAVVEGVVESEVPPQVIHVKMEDGLDYIMDGTPAGITEDSIIYNVQDDSGNIIQIEKPGGIGGRIVEQECSDSPISHTDNGSTSLINVGQSSNLLIQNPDGSHTTLVARKPMVVRNDNNTKMERRTVKSQIAGQNVGKNSNSASSGGGGGSKGVDRLPITPFLKGKTPVMLMVGEDGRVSTDVASAPPIKIDTMKKSETAEKVESAVGSSSNINISRPNVVSEPMILDFTTEKMKLENSLKAAVVSEGEKGAPAAVSIITSTTADTATTTTTEKDFVTDSKGGREVDNTIESVKENENKSEESVAENNENSENIGSPPPATDAEADVTDEEKEPEDGVVDSMEVDEDSPEKLEPADETIVVKCCMYDKCEHVSTDPYFFADHLEKEHGDPSPYCCFHCDKKFKLYLTLKIHQLFHVKNARPAKKKRGPYGARDKFYHCPVCSVQNKYKRDAQLHLKEEHDVEKFYTCESCKFICLTQMELDEHNEKVTHRTDNKDYCDICDQLFTNIYQHKAAVHTNERPHCCTECGYKAKTKSSLRYHMVTHLKTKDWQCPTCPYKTTTERRLKRHMKIHDPNKKHICNLCSFSTHDSYEYKRHHIKVHSKTKTYTCKFCDQKFDKHHEIRLHLMFEHDCNDAFFCNHCDFTCSMRAEYKEHIQTHYGRHRHVCEICGFTGRYKTHYRRHMLTHSDEKPYECTVCGKKVSEASNLRRHMLTHTEDKPLVCSVCGYRCKIRSRLMNHMKTHSELRPFACHLCKYTTKFNGNLVKHLENHAKYKPHKCEYCSYSCNERNKLKRHMVFRHKGLAEPKQEPVEEMNGESIEINNDTATTSIEVSSGSNSLHESTKDHILLLPNKELVIMQGDEERRIVLPVDENGLVMASADQEELMAQLQSGNIVLTVEDALPDSEQSHHHHHHQASSNTTTVSVLDSTNGVGDPAQSSTSVVVNMEG